MANEQHPRNSADDLALRSEQEVDDPTGRRGYADKLEGSGSEPDVGEREEPVEQDADEANDTDEVKESLAGRDAIGDQRVS